MIEGQFGNPPESYLKTILPLIEVARGLLEKGEQLVPIAFVGNFATGKTVQVLLREREPMPRRISRRWRSAWPPTCLMPTLSS